MTDLTTQIRDVIDKHYPAAYECSDCGTHLECSCRSAGTLDSWTSQHVAEEIVKAIEGAS